MTQTLTIQSISPQQLSVAPTIAGESVSGVNVTGIQIPLVDGSGNVTTVTVLPTNTQNSIMQTFQLLQQALPSGTVLLITTPQS